MKEEIDDIKKCYDPEELEKYSNDNEKLAWMFFVNGCAILQAVYMRCSNSDDVYHVYGPSFIKNDLLTFVYSDLFLLENQIPFRVLELLTSSSGGEQFMNAIKRFIDDTVITPAEDRFASTNTDFAPVKAGGSSIKESEFTYCIYYDNEARTKRSHPHTIRNVKELKKVGIWLKASKTSCLTDISFNRIFFVGKLCLLPITVNDSTMNLIAYEMCPDFYDDFTVTSYMCFLDLLIDEAEDVKDLRAVSILYNRLGSDEEVAKIFNKMNTDLVPSSMISSEFRRKIHNFCKTARINHVAQAYHTYVSSIWTFLAFVGAITALLLGALQTYYTIHQQK
ncbi:hypothetical protein PVK06_041824 [Gossypium arboreum]|uniref:Uncharacterized protein n=1 Tax=Gossypium arboreum TaxID=29729 RepID=A0ABR0N9B5_GOSAR|nr:hypothetical protein PVK06_041824 [Gossypium arboreum]